MRVCPEVKEASSCCRLRLHTSSRTTVTQWAIWGTSPLKADLQSKSASSNACRTNKVDKKVTWHDITAAVRFIYREHVSYGFSS